MSDPVKNNSSNREKSGAESARTRSTNENSAGKMPRKRKKHSLSFNAVLMLVILAVGLVAGVGLTKFFQVTDRYEQKSTTLSNVFAESNDIVTCYNYYTGIGKIEGSKQFQEWNIPFTGKRLLYTFQGKALLGINGKKIEVDTDEENKIIHVHCPAIQILSNEIDPGWVEVYDASNNIFNPLTAEEIYDNLEVEKSKQEEEMLSNGAIEAAESNAKSALTDILRLSGKVDGYTIEVTVEPTDLLTDRSDILTDSGEKSFPKDADEANSILESAAR